MLHRTAFLVIAALLLLARPTPAVRCDSPRPPEELGIDLSLQDRCDPLVPERCLLPFPSDYFTVRDRGTATGRRVSLVQEALPHLKKSRHAAVLNVVSGAAFLFSSTVSLYGIGKAGLVAATRSMAAAGIVLMLTDMPALIGIARRPSSSTRFRLGPRPRKLSVACPGVRVAPTASCSLKNDVPATPNSEPTLNCVTAGVNCGS